MRFWRDLSLAFAALTAPLCAEPAITLVPYDSLVPHLTTVIDFEDVPAGPEPGVAFDAPMFAKGLWLGEAFDGQTLQARTGPTGAVHDWVAAAPLDLSVAGLVRVRPGATGQNLSVAFHRGFGSNALFPLGPSGFPEIQSRGEGSLALAPQQPQSAIALRVHAAYADALGRSETGPLTLLAYGEDGTFLGEITLTPPAGVVGLGIVTLSGQAEIAGLIVQSLDPGGFAVDDIRIAPPSPSG